MIPKRIATLAATCARSRKASEASAARGGGALSRPPAPSHRPSQPNQSSRSDPSAGPPSPPPGAGKGSTTATEDLTSSWPDSWKLVLRQSIERGDPVRLPTPPRGSHRTSRSASRRGSKHKKRSERRALDDDEARTQVGSDGGGGDASANDASVPPRLAAIAPCSREQHNVPEPVAAPAADSAIAAGASTAKNLGLRVCGVELSSLLSDQLAAEAENHRVVKAFGVMNASVTVLTPSVLDLILKIKQPPSVLAKVLEAAMIVVIPSDATPRPASLAGVGGSAWRAFGLTGEQLASHIRAVDVDAVSDDQLAALVPYYNEITHKDAEDVNQFCRHLWAWVSAVGVICGVPKRCSSARTRPRAASLRRRSEQDQASLALVQWRAGHRTPLLRFHPLAQRWRDVDGGGPRRRSVYRG